MPEPIEIDTPKHKTLLEYGTPKKKTLFADDNPFKSGSKSKHKKHRLRKTRDDSSADGAITLELQKPLWSAEVTPKKSKGNDDTLLLEPGSSVTSPSSCSPTRSLLFITISGKAVYYCSTTSALNLQYTKIILENKSESGFSYVILRIINKVNRKVLFPEVKDIRKTKSVMVKINKAFLEYSMKNVSLNSFGEIYMTAMTRTLTKKITNPVTHTLDLSNVDSKRKYILGVVDPEFTTTHNLHDHKL
jgi:hypothetical protein